MNDADLKQLYRRMTRDDGTVPDAEQLHAVLQRGGAPDVEGTPLDQVAGSALQADLVRTLQALAPDAASLQRELAALRAPRRPRAAQGWLALAAGVGAAAILIAALRPATAPAPIAAEAIESSAIFSMSFESGSAQARADRDQAAPIFTGDFDS
jgi:hypothetical protein